jgi:hypothetical protein
MIVEQRICFKVEFSGRAADLETACPSLRNVIPSTGSFAFLLLVPFTFIIITLNHCHWQYKKNASYPHAVTFSKFARTLEPTEALCYVQPGFV